MHRYVFSFIRLKFFSVHGTKLCCIFLHFPIFRFRRFVASLVVLIVWVVIIIVIISRLSFLQVNFSSCLTMLMVPSPILSTVSCHRCFISGTVWALEPKFSSTYGYRTYFLTMHTSRRTYNRYGTDGPTVYIPLLWLKRKPETSTKLKYKQ